MSYRVAFVSFRNSDNFYPVNCHRGDIKAGDVVYVTMPKKRVHKKATVKAVEYLNWKCSNTIYCLVSELKQNDGSNHIIQRQTSDVKYHTSNDLITFLTQSGWKQVAKNSPRSPLYYWIDNESKTARLRFHGKGIDIQIFSFHAYVESGHEGRKVPHITDGKIARHRYYHSKRCIFEFIADFAQAFSQNESDLTFYLKEIGENGPKKSDVSDFQVGRANNSNTGDGGLTLGELYNIMSDGRGGPAYLGDGVYLGSDGTTFE